MEVHSLILLQNHPKGAEIVGIMSIIGRAERIELIFISNGRSLAELPLLLLEHTSDAEI